MNYFVVYNRHHVIHSYFIERQYAELSLRKHAGRGAYIKTLSSEELNKKLPHLYS